VIDPLNLQNNTTRTAYRYKEIKSEFKRARKVLAQELACMAEGEESKLADQQNLVQKLL
jgi:hypothetical protein